MFNIRFRDYICGLILTRKNMKKKLFSLLMLLSVAGAAKAQFSPGNQIINVNFNRGA